jgi:hypothetical protein
MPLQWQWQIRGHQVARGRWEQNLCFDASAFYSTQLGPGVAKANIDS